MCWSILFCRSFWFFHIDSWYHFLNWLFMNNRFRNFFDRFLHTLYQGKLLYLSFLNKCFCLSLLFDLLSLLFFLSLLLLLNFIVYILNWFSWHCCYRWQQGLLFGVLGWWFKSLVILWLLSSGHLFFRSFLGQTLWLLILLLGSKTSLLSDLSPKCILFKNRLLIWVELSLWFSL